jgi:hypothetical protein
VLIAQTRPVLDAFVTALRFPGTIPEHYKAVAITPRLMGDDLTTVRQAYAAIRGDDDCTKFTITVSGVGPHGVVQPDYTTMAADQSLPTLVHLGWCEDDQLVDNFCLYNDHPTPPELSAFLSPAAARDPAVAVHLLRPLIISVMKSRIDIRGLEDIDRLLWIYTYTMQREYCDEQKRAGE